MKIMPVPVHEFESISNKNVSISRACSRGKIIIKCLFERARNDVTNYCTSDIQVGSSKPSLFVKHSSPWLTPVKFRHLVISGGVQFELRI